MQRLLLCFIILIIACPGIAQKDARLAKGLLPIEQIGVERMPAQDNEALLREELSRRGPGVAPRYATNISVDISPEQNGTWESTPNGKVWRLRIHSPEAHSINLGFTDYFMPKGGQLILYTPDYREVRGPFTPADNEEHEQLWTPLLNGDEIVIEVQVPDATADQLQLKLSYVNHAFENFSALISGSCNLDVICGAADGWGIVDPHRDIIQSVAVISTGGGTFCTGFLVNNVENDCTPFFMTANHCGINSGNAASLVTYWNFQNSTCREPFSAASGGAGDGQLDDFNTGSIFRSRRSASDFVLVELDDPISPTANAYLAGWDASAAPISSAIAIHHPRTDEKRISFENDPTQFTTYGSSIPTSNFTHVHVNDWDVGTTEPGSSGSPLFDQNERVVGQLHGGGAACGNNLSDWYGSFAVSWDAGGSASSRLRDWLDPNNTGTLVINGRWANECGFSITADPINQVVCQPDDALYEIEVSSNFSGSVTLSAEDLPPGANAFFSPTVVSPGGNSLLSIQTDGVDPGSYTFTVIGENGGDTGELSLSFTLLADTSTPPFLFSPADNSTDIFPNPVLSWDGDDTGATTYEVQIATDINFSNIVESATTNATSYQSMNANEGSTRYYWRVRAMNDCGSSPYSDPFTFLTDNISCITYTSDFSTTISEVGTPSIENDIFFNEDEEIASVTVMLDITHTYVGDLDAFLLPPSGGSLPLFDRPGFPNSDFGCSEDNLRISFSADSPNSATALENTCNNSETGPNIPGPPYAIEGSYQPIGNLGNLAGESSLGLWTLQVNDNAAADGGVLEEWSVTVCYELPSEPPVLLTNEMLVVPHGTQETITNNYLEAFDAMSSPDEIFFILTDMPNEGMLILDGVMLNLGDSFTQEDIDNGLLVYQHEGGVVLTDEFVFDLENSAGLVTPDNVFEIEIVIEPLTVGYNQLTENVCNGDATASLEVIADGGVMPYEYALNGTGFQSENIFAGLSAGSYFVSVRDMTGSVISTNDFLIMHPEELIVMAMVDDDQIAVIATGGTPPYTYQLNDNPPQDEFVFSNLANGTYTITVTDANGCQTITSATVAVNTLAISTAIVQQISCHNANDGIITGLASGGTPPYQYRINGGPLQTESVFSNLGPGTYTIEVVDQEGFTLAGNPLTIVNPPLLVLTVDVDENTVTLEASGGTPLYVYQLDDDPTQASPIFTDLANGTYTMSVIDANSCITSTEVTIAVNTLVVNLSPLNDIDCHDANNGSIIVSASGGTTPYQYSLDGINYQAANTFTGLSAGTYTVTVRDAEGFTRTTNSVTITNPPALIGTVMVADRTVTVNASGGTAPLSYQLNGGSLQSSPIFEDLPNGTYTITVIDANGCELDLSATIAVNTLVVSATLTNDISCFNANDGVITVNVSGGTLPYNYSLDGVNFQQDNTFSNLAAGTYTVTVLDSEGFTQTTNSVTVTNPAALTGSLSVNEDEITVSASGGTAPLMYQLNDGALQTEPIFSMLANGQYTVTIIDANGCTLQLSATIAVNTLIVSANLENDITCPGLNDGRISASVSGGTPPYQYSLDGVNFVNGNVFPALPAGTYTITVMDAEGFTAMTNQVTLNDPSAITGNVEVMDDMITVTASGGTPPLMYTINGGIPQNSPVFSMLPNGEYIIVVIDANGCALELNATVAVNTLMVNAFLESDVTCFDVNDAQISVAVSGGTPPFQYSLDGENYQAENTFSNLSPGTYTVTVLDDEGFTQTTNTITVSNPPELTASVAVEENTITVSANGGTEPLLYQLNGMTPQDEPVFAELPNGEYTITVIDANGCTQSFTETISINTLVVSIELLNDISCFNVNDASITANVSGGTPPYQYSLDGVNYQTEGTFTGLAAGTYTITVLDAEGFMQQTGAVTVTNPAALMMNVVVDESTISISAGGGTGDLEYSIDGLNFQPESVFPDLPDGVYQVTVRDENGCAIIMEAIIGDNNLLASGEVSGIITCAGDATATITASASGGTPPYRYSLDGGNTWQTSGVFGGLPAGTYQITVEDAMFNTYTSLAIIIDGPPQLEATANGMDNTITIGAAGGTPPYEYSLDGSTWFSTNTFTDIPPGDYIAWIRDANGCLVNTEVSIVVGVFNPEAPEISLVVYPNPNSGQFYVQLNQETGSIITLQVYDPRGRLIRKTEVQKTSLQFKHYLDLSDLPAGMYQLILNDGERFGRAKVAVVK